MQMKSHHSFTVRRRASLVCIKLPRKEFIANTTQFTRSCSQGVGAAASCSSTVQHNHLPDDTEGVFLLCHQQQAPRQPCLSKRLRAKEPEPDHHTVPEYMKILHKATYYVTDVSATRTISNALGGHVGSVESLECKSHSAPGTVKVHVESTLWT